MLAGAVMLPVASIAGLPLLIPLTPEPVFAVEATRTPVRAQSFTTPDTVTGTVMVRGDYTVAVTAPVGTESYAHTADTFTNDPASALQWPFTVGVPISSTFGYRTPPCPSCSNFHAGLDMTPGIGTPIQAIADGVVTTATEQGGAYGVYVVIRHEIDGQVVESAYAHMREGSLALTPGQTVRVGQMVGRVGDSGRSFGAHLHFEIRTGGEAVDPLAWLPARVRS